MQTPSVVTPNVAVARTGPAGYLHLLGLSSQLSPVSLRCGIKNTVARPLPTLNLASIFEPPDLTLRVDLGDARCRQCHRLVHRHPGEDPDDLAHRRTADRRSRSRAARWAPCSGIPVPTGDGVHHIAPGGDRQVTHVFFEAGPKSTNSGRR